MKYSKWDTPRLEKEYVRTVRIYRRHEHEDLLTLTAGFVVAMVGILTSYGPLVLAGNLLMLAAAPLIALDYWRFNRQHKIGMMLIDRNHRKIMRNIKKSIKEMTDANKNTNA